MKHEDIKNVIKELIEKTKVQVADITIIEDKGNTTWFSVEVNEPHFFTQHEGEALQALNHLIRRIIEVNEPNPSVAENTNKKRDTSILVDINGFQKRKVESIRTIAHMMAERARYFKANVEVDPMPAFDRRIIHEFLSEMSDLKTESAGFGPTRHVVIKYVGEI